MDRHIYKPLSLRQIRVLALVPGRAGDDLQCEINVFAVDSPDVEYEALSYVWGSSQSVALLKCGNGAVPITRNLRAALKSLRLQNETRFLWADQICINQLDVAERASQVLLMGEIFQRASQVIMWLGPGSQSEPKLPDLASSLVKKLATIPKEVFLDQELPSDAILAQRGLPPLNSSQWHALDVFLSIPYWERCWILQEIRLARHRHVVWGSTRYDWEEIQLAVLYVLHNIQLHTGTLAVVNANRLEKIHMIPQQAKGLYQYLQISRNRKATDERDKVFSLLGMLESPLDDVEVDYSKSIPSVFTQAAQHIIRKHESLALLRHAGFQNHTKGLGTAGWPSWVPQWQDDEVWSLSLSDPSVNADDGLACHCKFDCKDTSKIVVQGIEFDKVLTNSTLDRLRHPEPVLKDIALRVPEAWLMCRNTEVLKHCNEPLIKIFLRTLFCGGYHISNSEEDTSWRDELYGDFAKFWAIQQVAQPSESSSIEILKQILEPADAAVIANEEWLPDSVPMMSELWQAMRRVVREDFYAQAAGDSSWAHNVTEQAAQLRTRLQCRWSEELIDEAVWWILPLAYVSGNHGHFPRRYRESTYWRRFFVSKEGRLGMGPEASRIGDIVAVVFGCKIPQLLRPVRSGYELLGECYIDGLMHGEGIETLRRNGILEEYIKQIKIA